MADETATATGIRVQIVTPVGEAYNETGKNELSEKA